MLIIVMALFEKMESSPEIDINAELPKTKIKLRVTSVGYIFTSFKNFMVLLSFVRNLYNRVDFFLTLIGFV